MKTDKKILVTGGTGFIGDRLRSQLVTHGSSITIATRHPEAHRTAQAAVEYAPWLPDLSKFDAVVHLAGEPLLGRRWNAAYKDLLLSSRVEGTRRVVDAIAAASRKPQVLISASAIGFYGDQGERWLPESGKPGVDFLAMLCQRWEKEALRAEELGVRVVTVRTGVVLGREGGALKQMLLPFKLGLGGPFGSGSAYTSWIHVRDLCELMYFAIVTPALRGPVNGVAPGVCTNKEYVKALGRALHRPAVLPIPPFAIKLAFGEVAGVMLASQRCVPKAALDAGFQFQFPDIDGALRDLVG
jgi:uncharacterized protein (TIGR01777 family)